MRSMAVVETIKNRDRIAIRAGRMAISGKRKGIRAVLPFIGPAFITAVAYVDPGNYATNIQGGSMYGYNLLWVVALANLIALVLQNLSAKLGIATGKNLPELCRDCLPKWLSLSLWVVSEIAAMATDLAEFLGASLAIHLLMNIPLMASAIITGGITYLILMLDRFGFRPLEIFIGMLLCVIALSYTAETIFSRPNWGQVLHHVVTPWIGSSGSVVLMVGILGATVMPHALYLHSGLTQHRIVPKTPKEAKRIYHFQKIDVILSMVLAGLVNIAMMYMAASAFHASGHTGVVDISRAYQTLTPLLGGVAASVFLLSLLASGLSSSAVGTMAGQVIMQGFVGFAIPVWVRRVVTMLPTFIVIALGADPMQSLILSQVVLSLALPAPVITLVYFTSRRKIMGALVNRPFTRTLAGLLAVMIVGLNLLLVVTVLTHTA